MKIIIDAMGSDNGVRCAVDGILRTVDKIDSKFVVFGNEKEIRREFSLQASKERFDEIINKVTIIHAEETITNDDEAAMSIKSKKNSSMVKALLYLKDIDEEACMISAGSTGALMSGALLFLGRLKGIKRPALSPMLPTYNRKGFLLVDSGANVNATEEQLVQFADLGTIYMRCIRNIDNPKVALLNVGTEEKKGTDFLKDVHKRLKEDRKINFCGNIEGRDIFDGEIDIVVCSGLIGNITLKTIEGMGMMINKMLKEELTGKWYNSALTACLMPALKNFKKRIDYTEYGGALLLGIQKPVIKCHGSSNGKAFESTILQAENIMKNRVIERIKNNLEE